MKNVLNSCFIFIAILVAQCGPSKPPEKPKDPCAQVGDIAPKVWNADVKAKLKLSVKIVRGEIEASNAEILTSRLDNLTDDWAELRGKACISFEVEKSLSAEEHSAAVDCLKDALEAERSAISTIKKDATDALNLIDDLENGLKNCRRKLRGSDADLSAGEP